MLDAEPRDLGIDRCRDLLLRLLDLGALLRRCADDVERAPGQHAGDGIEVRGIDIAAHPRRLERDRAAAAERVGDLRPMAEAAMPNCSTSSGIELRIGAEMPIHLWPDAGKQLRLVAFLGPADMLQPLIEAVGQGGERLRDPRLALVVVEIAPPDAPSASSPR